MFATPSLFNLPRRQPRGKPVSLRSVGNEIFYCSVCRGQIRTSDFDSGKAFQLENRHFCLTCGPEMLRTLPQDKVKDIFKSITTPSKSAPAVHDGPARPPSSSRGMRVARPSTAWKIPAAAAAGVAVLVVLWLLLQSPSAPDPAPTPLPAPRPVARPVERPAPAPAPIPVRKPEPVVVPVAPAPAPAADKETVARDSIRKARDWAAANPSDFDGAVRKFQDAAFLATGTSSMAEANQELERYRQKQRDFFAKEFAALEPEVKAAFSEERFMKAIDLLRLAKDRHGAAEWQLLVGKRLREINDDAFRMLNRIKDEALEAQARGDEEKVKALRARVASWGVERFAKDFRDAVDK